MSSNLWYLVTAATRYSYTWHDILKKSGSHWSIWPSLSSALSSLPLKGWITWTLQCIIVQLHSSDPISENTAQDLISTMRLQPRESPLLSANQGGATTFCEEDELFSAKELLLWESSDKIATSFLLSEFSLYQHLKWPPWEELVLLGKQNVHLFCQLPYWVKDKLCMGIERHQLFWADLWEAGAEEQPRKSRCFNKHPLPGYPFLL